MANERICVTLEQRVLRRGALVRALAVFVVTIAAVVAAALLSLPASAAPVEDDPASLAIQQPVPPNIILILADDLDLELDTVTTMPHLQALLAGQGVTFSNFFTNASICCPSRASLLRGQYVHNHAVYTNGPPGGGFETFRDLGLENDTIATRLARRRVSHRAVWQVSQPLSVWECVQLHSSGLERVVRPVAYPARIRPVQLHPER